MRWPRQVIVAAGFVAILLAGEMLPPDLVALRLATVFLAFGLVVALVWLARRA
jgi:hypothetical protein